MMQGRFQDFKLGGAHLSKLRRAEGGAKIVEVFRVKNPPWIRPWYYIYTITNGIKKTMFRVFGFPGLKDLKKKYCDFERT